MKTTLNVFLITLLIFTIQSCSFKSIRGNGVITEKEINISDYSEIVFGGSANIVYEQKTDAAPYLKIEIDENIFPLLKIKSENGILSIEQESGSNIRPTKYNIFTNSTALANVNTSGSAKIHIKGKLQTENLNFRLSGSGNVVVDDVTCNSISSRVSGSGDITLSGKATSIDNAISGSGKVNAMDLYAEDVTCTVSGSGNFWVHAEKNLKVNVSGSGNVRYKGNPQIDQSISGSGKVIKED
ncbi:MAG: head GIN domain-containing protein [Dysgonomonas sp.]